MSQLQTYKQMHMEKFGVAPVIIGLFWDAPLMFERYLKRALDESIPYNEVDMLSEAELRDYLMGRFIA